MEKLMPVQVLDMPLLAAADEANRRDVELLTIMFEETMTAAIR